MTLNRERLNNIQPAAAGLLAVFFTVGTVSHLIAFLRPWMMLLTPFVLFVVGVLTVVFWWAQTQHPPRPILLWVLITYVVTFSLEALGTHTGLVFGAYTYGQGLGPMLMAVPLVIGFNWTIVVLGTHAWFAWLKQPWQRVLATAAGCVLFDVVMEPVAMNPKMDYWNWALGHVPLQNYVAWFVIAALAAIYFEVLKLRPAGLFARAFVLIQVIFFVVLLVGFQVFHLA
jgi:putative membrane protein